MQIIYNCELDLNGLAIKQFLRSMKSMATHVSLVTRMNREPEPTGKDMLNLIRPELLEVQVVSEWPGTKLLYGGKVNLHFYNLSDGFINSIAKSIDSFKDLVWPDYPEDICLYRSDRTPLFVTITHENDSYFDISEEEFQVVKSRCPALVLTKNPDYR